MFEYIFIATIGFCLLLLYIFINSQSTASKVFGKALTRDTRHKRSETYIQYFRESKQSSINRNIVVQLLPWIGVLAVVVILSNQYFYFGTVLSGSMEPLFKRGDLVLMQAVDKEPKMGDIIMFSVAKFTQSVEEPITHRIISIDENGNIHTKGDANPDADKWVLTEKNIMGKAITLGGQPVALKGFGSILVPEAGKFSIMNKMPEGMEITVLFQRFRAIQPVLIFFATIFYLFLIIETRVEENRRFGRNGKKSRTKTP